MELNGRDSGTVPLRTNGPGVRCVPFGSNRQTTIYDIGGGLEHTTGLVEFIMLLESKTNERTSITYNDWHEGDQKVDVSDIARTREHLDWEARVDFETGVDRFVDWHRDR